MTFSSEELGAIGIQSRYIPAEVEERLKKNYLQMSNFFLVVVLSVGFALLQKILGAFRAESDLKLQECCFENLAPVCELPMIRCSCCGCCWKVVK